MTGVPIRGSRVADELSTHCKVNRGNRLILVVMSQQQEPSVSMNPYESNQQPSALSQLNFGIDGFEFTAGIVDSHLPVDAALSGVDIV